MHGESGQRPDPASEVLRKRFGDCKGSAILTRDMLRAVGIDARLVWIGTRDIGTDWTDIPNISSGNHMISAVMLPGDSIMFLDGTSTYSTPGNQPYGITGCQAMSRGHSRPLHHQGACPTRYPDTTSATNISP